MSTAGSVTISYTTLAEVALVAALVGGIAYIGSSKSANQPHPTSSSLAPQPPAAGAKKSNKKKKGAKTAPTAVEPVVEAATAVKDHVVAGASAAVQRAQPAVQEAVAQVKQVATQVQEVAAGAATKKSGGGKKANKKGSPKPDATKPDATKHAEQKVVHEQSDRADMVDPKDHPQVARVMKVVGGKVGAAPPPPAPSAAQGDGEWESLEDDEGGWESVVSKSGSTRPCSWRSLLLRLTCCLSPTRTLPAVDAVPERERLVRRRLASRTRHAYCPDDQEAARERCEKGQGAVGEGRREPRAGGTTEAVPSRAGEGAVRSFGSRLSFVGVADCDPHRADSPPKTPPARAPDPSRKTFSDPNRPRLRPRSSAEACRPASTRPPARSCGSRVFRG